MAIVVVVVVVVCQIQVVWLQIYKLGSIHINTDMIQCWKPNSCASFASASSLLIVWEPDSLCVHRSPSVMLASAVIKLNSLCACYYKPIMLVLAENCVFCTVMILLGIKQKIVCWFISGIIMSVSLVSLKLSTSHVHTHINIPTCGVLRSTSNKNISKKWTAI